MIQIIDSGRNIPRLRKAEIIQPAIITLLKSEAARLISKIGHGKLIIVPNDNWILNHNVWFSTNHRDLIFTFACSDCCQVFRVLPYMITRAWSPTLWLTTRDDITIIRLAPQLDAGFALQLRNHFCPRLKAVF